LARDERWGRTYEAFGETVELASAMGVAYTNGFPRSAAARSPCSATPSIIWATAHRQRGQQRQHRRRRGGAARVAPHPLRGRRARRHRIDHGLVQQLAGDALARERRDVNGVLKGDLGFAGFVGSDYTAATRTA